MARIDVALRLALWNAWDHKCAWCGNPLDLEELEVEHLVAAGLTGAALRDELQRLALPHDYDVDATENLVPAHGRPCNRQKSMKPLPNSPRIELLRQDAANRAASVDRGAQRYRKATKLTEAVAIIEAAEPGEVSAAQHGALVRAASIVAAHLRVPDAVRIHSSVDPHDYIVPDATEATDIFGPERFRDLLVDFATYHDLHAVVEEGFNADGQIADASHVRRVERIVYISDLDMFIVRTTFSVSYTHLDDDGNAGPADADLTLDLWTELDDARSEVLEVFVDYSNAMPPTP